MEKKKCPKCNVEMDASNNFCGKCGYRFEELDKSSESVSNAKKPNFQKKKIIIILAVICVVTMALIFILFPKIKSTVEKKNKYSSALTYIENNKYQDAINILREIDTYKDSQEKLNESYYKLAETRYKEGDLKAAAENYYSAGKYGDAMRKYTSTTYEYGKQLVAKWDYINAAKQFKKIDYNDSKELASLYVQFDTNRYHNHKFYYYAEEFEDKLNSLLQEENENFSAKIDDDNITDTPVIYVYNKEKFTGVYLSLAKYDKNGMCEGFDIRWTNVSKSEENFGTTTYIYSILLADCSLTAQDANDYYMELVKKAEKNILWGKAFCNDTRNGISYHFWYSSDDNESGLLINNSDE